MAPETTGERAGPRNTDLYDEPKGGKKSMSEVPGRKTKDQRAVETTYAAKKLTIKGGSESMISTANSCRRGTMFIQPATRPLDLLAVPRSWTAQQSAIRPPEFDSGDDEKIPASRRVTITPPNVGERAPPSCKSV